MPYAPNEGRIPEAALIRGEDGEVTGFRAVHVRLFGGWDSRAAGHAPWPSGSFRQPSTRWEISRKPHPFEIEEFEVV